MLNPFESLSLRYDRENNKGVVKGYFPWLMFGYGLGLCLTYWDLYIMNGHGQPALLYLVPCTVQVTKELLKGERTK